MAEALRKHLYLLQKYNALSPHKDIMGFWGEHAKIIEEGFELNKDISEAMGYWWHYLCDNLEKIKAERKI